MLSQYLECEAQRLREVFAKGYVPPSACEISHVPMVPADLRGVEAAGGVARWQPRVAAGGRGSRAPSGVG